MYDPKPLDTSHVKLNTEQKELIEKLAANTHDVWAQKRIDDGWTYGVERNDKAKTHPCLIPYDELSNEEKAYDQEMVRQVIKTLVVMGKLS